MRTRSLGEALTAYARLRAPLLQANCKWSESYWKYAQEDTRYLQWAANWEQWAEAELQEPFPIEKIISCNYDEQADVERNARNNCYYHVRVNDHGARLICVKSNCPAWFLEIRAECC